MAGRKWACPPATVIDAVILFKDRVITTSDSGEKRKYSLIFNSLLRNTMVLIQ